MTKLICVELARVVRQTKRVVVEVPDDFPGPDEPRHMGDASEHAEKWDELCELAWHHDRSRTKPAQDDKLWSVDEEWGADEGTHRLMQPERRPGPPVYRLRGNAPENYTMQTIRSGKGNNGQAF